MCSKPVRKALNVAAAVIAPVATLANVGTYGAGKGAVQGAQEGGVKGALTGAVSGAQSGFTDPVGTIAGKPTTYTPDDTADPSTPDTPGSGAPSLPAPGISNLAESRRRRRLASLRMGILSTIRSGAAGDTSSANLLTPAAGAGPSTGKTLLGQ